MVVQPTIFVLTHAPKPPQAKEAAEKGQLLDDFPYICQVLLSRVAPVSSESQRYFYSAGGRHNHTGLGRHARGDRSACG